MFIMQERVHDSVTLCLSRSDSVFMTHGGTCIYDAGTLCL